MNTNINVKIWYLNIIPLAVLISGIVLMFIHPDSLHFSINDVKEYDLMLWVPLIVFIVELAALWKSKGVDMMDIVDKVKETAKGAKK